MDVSLGDLSTLTASARRSSAIKTEIDRLTGELASGRVHDVSAHLGSDLNVYAEIEARLVRLGALDAAATESDIFGNAVQNALEYLSDVSDQLTSDFLTASNSGLGGAHNQSAKAARDTLDAMVSTLNGSVGGRSLFSGIATDQRPLASADMLLTALRTEVAGATSVADIEARVAAWFDDPAGFDSVMYQGSDQSLSPIRIGEGLSVTFDLRADDPAIKDVFRMAALGALSDDPGLALSVSDKSELFRAAGVGQLSVSAGLAETRGSVGATQARIDTALSRNAATRTSLDYTRAELVSADAFEVAVRLEQAQFQLESLFAVTARSARLSLVDYL